MSSSPLKVLIVDDDEDDYLIIRDLLADIREAEFEIEWTSAYDSALPALIKRRFDVCLADYHLGSSTGLDLIREALASDCRAPIILLTGQGDREVDMEAMKAGAADYLVKPLDEGELLECIQNILGQLNGEARNRILVVDDEIDIVGWLKHFLTHYGYEVMEAYDGVQALEAV